MENKRKIGSEKEEMAKVFLMLQGVRVRDRNYYFPGGEIDLIAQDGEYLCFIEVKYRKSRAYGYPEEAVTPAKQEKIIWGAKHYMLKNRIFPDVPCRFDVISIYDNEINWIKDAFTL